MNRLSLCAIQVFDTALIGCATPLPFEAKNYREIAQVNDLWLRIPNHINNHFII
jgi:hypothetical protein